MSAWQDGGLGTTLGGENCRSPAAGCGRERPVALGLTLRHIFHLGKLPVNAQIGGYYNIIRPDNGPTFQLRVQVQFMFPK